MMRTFASIVANFTGGLLLPLAALGAGTAQDTTSDVDHASPSGVTAENNPLTGQPEITPELEAAVTRGLSFLAHSQGADGSFGEDERYGKNVGITGLCALAFMADGHLPGRGEYGENVARALDYVLDHCTETGLIVAGNTHGPMYGHGFATLFLGEIYGAGGDQEDPRVREALVKAVQLIVKTQNSEGGWRYNPIPEDADTSVTICQVMALRSARNAGIDVPRETIDRAVKYVRDCQNPDGGFRYMTSPGTSLWPRSAASVATMYYSGIYNDPAINTGLGYLMIEAMPGLRRTQAHYYYGQYYTSQAMYLAGGNYWAKWWPAAREELLSRQSADAGSWNDPTAGPQCATAMALIALQVPKRYLPIFQK